MRNEIANNIYRKVTIPDENKQRLKRKIIIQEKITLNKYGRMKLKYLKEHKKADHTIMFMDGTLNAHLKEIQETADNRVQQIISELKAKGNLTEEFFKIKYKPLI